jgi:hypothetical protein
MADFLSVPSEMTNAMTQPRFYRSTFCANTHYVEVAPVTDGAFVVRDSKDRSTELTYSPDEWRAFLQGVKAGEFDFGLFTSATTSSDA